MGGPRWREISVPLWSGPAPATVEALFAIFDEMGTPGAALFDDPPRVATYVPDDARANRLSALLRERVSSEGLRVTETVLEETDWSEAWKCFFRPRRVGRKLVICPSWEHVEAEPEDILLVLDPGQAFGTGEHATTQMCLTLLERHLLPGQAVLDVGIGSGILTIAALKLGASWAVGCDIDPVSAASAQENLRRNGCADRAEVVVAAGVAWCSASFGLCMSNLISTTIVRLAPQMVDHVAHGGCWILSGVSGENEAGVVDACVRAGFRIVDRCEEEQWVAMAVKR